MAFRAARFMNTVAVGLAAFTCDRIGVSRRSRAPTARFQHASQLPSVLHSVLLGGLAQKVLVCVGMETLEIIHASDLGVGWSPRCKYSRSIVAATR